ncbi:hypothetical protein NQ315_010789 [Exocentrus adspersus]|uniref:N-acetyl-D-glucosamine kinase n=1 Tax=Exocentrus adspersus TaxID=1586481 RepID=A0AAV8VW25_9CUCU|nr:hypothetical protein NQ315_010789 [Exocentrus adspersus]
MVSEKMPDVLIGGIEGGATHSHAVIMNSSGAVIGSASGPATNHHLVGMKECRKRIAELIDRAKIAAEIPTSTALHALGLSLSGCEQEETNQELVGGLSETYPNLAEKYVVGSDTEGSLAATSNNGGITCIAGTGSNTLLINPDRSKAQCGGWGYLLADEGSAFKIAHRAVKYCFDDLDKFEKPPHPTDKVWQLVRNHFKIKTQADILDSFYKDFDKAHIASLCKKLGDLARQGDELASSIFSEAGQFLATSISAVAPKAAAELTEKEGGLHVLCVGSVWLSWDLLRSGFVDWIEVKTDIKEMSLMRLKTEMGVGAALMASDRLHLPLYRDYNKNYTIFYHYKRGVSTAKNGSA